MQKEKANQGTREETEENKELREARHVREREETEEKLQRKKKRLVDLIEGKTLIATLGLVYQYRFDSLVDDIIEARKCKDVGMSQQKKIRQLEELVLEYHNMKK
jgi:hypothetical protein